jgi:hypothetical protein
VATRREARMEKKNQRRFEDLTELEKDETFLKCTKQMRFYDNLAEKRKLSNEELRKYRYATRDAVSQLTAVMSDEDVQKRFTTLY